MIRRGAEMNLTECLQPSPDEPVTATNLLNPVPIDGSIVAATGKVSETRDWASLPPDLLISIAGRLTSLADFYSFRRVCSLWRSNVVLSADSLVSQSPLVMLHIENREEEWEEEEDQCHDFPSFDLVFVDVVNSRFDKSEYSSCWRSFQLLDFSHGYIAKALGSGHIMLYHFFTNDKIWLPKTRKPFRSKSIIISENPSSPQCLFALYHCFDSTVEFCKQGDSNWKIGNLNDRIVIIDMVFFQGKMYAILYTKFVSDLYQLAVIEFNPSFTVKLLGVPTDLAQFPYIFTSGDELLICSACKVFAWDFKCSRWVSKSSLDGRAIFISPSQMTACINPTQNSWIKPNYKYYYDNSNHGLVKSLAIDPGVDDVSEEFFDYLAGEGIQSWCLEELVWIFPSMCFSAKV